MTSRPRLYLVFAQWHYTHTSIFFMNSELAWPLIDPILLSFPLFLIFFSLYGKANEASLLILLSSSPPLMDYHPSLGADFSEF